MTVFFIADTHFGHAGALGFYRRPFASVAAMDEVMIAQWNTIVGLADEVWHLGDFAVGADAERVAALLHGLHGRKHLITGNNDGPATTTAQGWTSVQPYAEAEVEGTSFVLCHYAFRTWRNMGRGWWNLHGHSHGRLQPMTRQVDVGVDVWQFRPVTLAQLTQKRRSVRA